MIGVAICRLVSYGIKVDYIRVTDNLRCRICILEFATGDAQYLYMQESQTSANEGIIKQLL